MLTSLLRGVAIMEPAEGLKDKLALVKCERRPLRVKLGFDPTAPDLHLGHAVVLRKLREFQEAGHKIIVIIGDFTASIGDPTGRNKMRPPLSREDINVNAETYLHQLGKVIELDKVEVRRNSEWHDKLNLRDTIALMSNMLARNIVKIYHGPAAAEAAAGHFARAVQSKKATDTDHTAVPVQRLLENGGPNQTLLDIATALMPDNSRKSIKRLIVEGGVRVNEEKVTNPLQEVGVLADTKVWIGKRNWFWLTAG